MAPANSRKAKLGVIVPSPGECARIAAESFAKARIRRLLEVRGQDKRASDRHRQQFQAAADNGGAELLRQLADQCEQKRAAHAEQLQEQYAAAMRMFGGAHAGAVAATADKAQRAEMEVLVLAERARTEKERFDAVREEELLRRRVWQHKHAQLVAQRARVHELAQEQRQAAHEYVPPVAEGPEEGAREGGAHKGQGGGMDFKQSCFHDVQATVLRHKGPAAASVGVDAPPPSAMDTAQAQANRQRAEREAAQAEARLRDMAARERGRAAAYLLQADKECVELERELQQLQAQEVAARRGAVVAAQAERVHALAPPAVARSDGGDAAVTGGGAQGPTLFPDRVLQRQLAQAAMEADFESEFLPQEPSHPDADILCGGAGVAANPAHAAPAASPSEWLPPAATGEGVVLADGARAPAASSAAPRNVATGVPPSSSQQGMAREALSTAVDSETTVSGPPLSVGGTTSTEVAMAAAAAATAAVARGLDTKGKAAASRGPTSLPGKKKAGAGDEKHGQGPPNARRHVKDSSAGPRVDARGALAGRRDGSSNTPSEVSLLRQHVAATAVAAVLEQEGEAADDASVEDESEGGGSEGGGSEGDGSEGSSGFVPHEGHKPVPLLGHADMPQVAGERWQGTRPQQARGSHRTSTASVPSTLDTAADTLGDGDISDGGASWLWAPSVRSETPSADPFLSSKRSSFSSKDRLASATEAPAEVPSGGGWARARPIAQSEPSPAPGPARTELRPSTDDRQGVPQVVRGPSVVVVDGAGPGGEGRTAGGAPASSGTAAMFGVQVPPPRFMGDGRAREASLTAAPCARMEGMHAIAEEDERSTPSVVASPAPRSQVAPDRARPGVAASQDTYGGFAPQYPTFGAPDSDATAVRSGATGDPPAEARYMGVASAPRPVGAVPSRLDELRALRDELLGWQPPAQPAPPSQAPRDTWQEHVAVMEAAHLSQPSQAHPSSSQTPAVLETSTLQAERMAGGAKPGKPPQGVAARTIEGSMDSMLGALVSQIGELDRLMLSTAEASWPPAPPPAPQPQQQQRQRQQLVRREPQLSPPMTRANGRHGSTSQPQHDMGSAGAWQPDASWTGSLPRSTASTQADVATPNPAGAVQQTAAQRSAVPGLSAHVSTPSEQAAGALSSSLVSGWWGLILCAWRCLGDVCSHA
eukprot:jgi/Mesvir1/1948/Mv22966-RA.2